MRKGRIVVVRAKICEQNELIFTYHIESKAPKKIKDTVLGALDCRKTTTVRQNFFFLKNRFMKNT